MTTTQVYGRSSGMPVRVEAREDEGWFYCTTCGQAFQAGSDLIGHVAWKHPGELKGGQK